MDTGNKYQVNDYNKTNNISTVDIMNENNNNNNMLENNNNDNNIFKQLKEEENEARKIEHELDTVSKSEILKAMPASFRFAAKLVFLFRLRCTAASCLRHDQKLNWTGDRMLMLRIQNDSCDSP